jgi:phage baseplate assembly protein W
MPLIPFTVGETLGEGSVSTPPVVSEPNPYGVDLVLDGEGDLVVWPNGALGTIEGALNCVQALTDRLKTPVGSLPMDPNYGTGFQEEVGKNTNPVVTEARAQQVMSRIVESDKRFLAVKEIKASEVQGSPTTTAVSATLILVTGQQVEIADILTASIEDLIDPEAVTLGSIEQINALEDQSFFAREPEAEELKEAATIEETVEDLTKPIYQS